MKLKRHLNRKDKKTGKEFYRYDVTIDPSLIEDELKWKANDDLEAEAKNKELRIRKKK